MRVNEHPEPTTVSTKVTLTLSSQLSLASGSGSGGNELQLAVVDGGIPVSTGGSVSFNTMVCRWLALLPQASVAVHMR